jgi:hypothetical protein
LQDFDEPLWDESQWIIGHCTSVYY